MMRFAECFHYWWCCHIQQHKGHSISPGVLRFVLHMLKFYATFVLMPFNQKHWWGSVIQIFNAKSVTVCTYSAIYVPNELSVCMRTELFSIPFPLFTSTPALCLLFFPETSHFLFSLGLCCYVLTPYCNIGQICLYKCGTDLISSSGQQSGFFVPLHFPSNNMLVVTAALLH
jgi:hypothetical protein